MTAIARLPEGAPEEVRKLAGSRACLRLVKASFDGFEQTELLVPVVVVEGKEGLPPGLGDQLLRSELRAVGERPPPVSPEWMDDAVEEALFAMQEGVDAAEHARFERAMRQGERYLDDRLLVLRRRRQRHLEHLEQAKQRRDGSTGARARAEAEGSVVTAQVALDEDDVAIERLERRDNETFRRFEAQIQERRYAPPRVETLFDLTLDIE